MSVEEVVEDASSSMGDGAESKDWGGREETASSVS